MTTIQKIRNIIKVNKEILGFDTTLEHILNGGYEFPTKNKRTIERTFSRVQDELELIAETERRVKYEFQSVAVMIAITFLVIGLAIGKYLM